jgi:predicted ATPase
MSNNTKYTTPLAISLLLTTSVASCYIASILYKQSLEKRTINTNNNDNDNESGKTYKSPTISPHKEKKIRSRTLSSGGTFTDDEYEITRLDRYSKVSKGTKGAGKIYKFVLTGGPCSGKTTASERIQVFLRERGFRVFVAQEAATMLFLNGASPDDFSNPGCLYAFQQFVIDTQMSLENSFENYARSTQQDCVIICDRGIMDGSAYVEKDEWNGILNYAGLDTISAREGRYDAVFHLVSAADGAEEFYSLANNLGSRHESCSEANRQDKRTQLAWSGHPHHVIIDNRNTKTFEKKLEQLLSHLATYVGLPSLARRSHKFVLLTLPDLDSLPNVQVFDVEKVMLRSAFRTENGLVDDNNDTSGSIRSIGQGKELYSFVRRRSQGGFHAYGLTTVKLLESGEKVELKQVISKRMYNMLTRNGDDKRHAVIQRRYCFLWEDQSFHIYEYLAPEETLGIFTLLCQCEGEPRIPPFLKVGSLQNNEDYLSSFTLSLKNKKTDISSPRLSRQILTHSNIETKSVNEEKEFINDSAIEI